MSDYNPADYNKGGFNAFMFSMAVTILFFIYISFLHPGVDLKEIPEEKPVEAKPETKAFSNDKIDGSKHVIAFA